MSLLEGIASLFGRQKTIDQISPDDLKRERITLEQAQNRIHREIAAMEHRKDELFLKGKDAASSRQRLDFAQQVAQVEREIRQKAKDMALVRKQLGIIAGLLQIKERAALLRSLKVGSIINRLSVEELAAYVDQATVDERFEMEKFTAMLEAVEGGADAILEAAATPEVRAIAAAMEQARAAEEAGRPEEAAAAAKRVEEVLSKNYSDTEES